MANNPVVTIDGLDALVRNLKRAEPAMLDTLRAINAEIAELAAGYVRDEAPIGPSGKLRDSVRVGRTLKSSVVKIGNARRVPYVGPIAFGWPRHNIKANPFIERAKDKAAPEVEALAIRRFDALLDTLSDGAA